jgi:hypothetical protein
MHPRLWRSCLGIFLGLMLLTTLPACGVQQLAKGELQAPRVTFQGLTIYRPTARGWPLGARLLLENPNSQSLNLLGYDYHVWIEGKSVAQGESQQAVNLSAMGQTVAEVPIVVQLPTVMELLPHFLTQRQKERKLHYQIAGSFRLASVLGGIIPIPFKFQGEATPQEGKDFLSPYLR